LARADVKLTPGEYVLLSITSILGFFLIGYLLFHQSLFMAIGAAVLGFYAPSIYLKIQQRRRLHAFNDQLGDTINLLANSLRSGYSLLQSMETVARELPPPISEEFARVVREVGLGLSNEQAMNKRVRIKGEIRVLTAQGVISSYVISFLPIGMGLLLYLMNPDYINAMFTELCGWIMTGVAVTGIVTGFIATQKIVRIEV
jgi:tight adherence protein B